MLSDLRYAFRLIAKSPGFFAVAILSLAIAISVNCTVSSLVNGIVLRPLISVRPTEVVSLFTTSRGTGYQGFSYTDYLSLRHESDTFADVAATYLAFASVNHGNRIDRHLVFFASENYFPMLGVQPKAGRFFNPEESRPNSGLAVVVTSYAFWRHEGGRPDFVGSTLRLNGKPYTVIGIAPEGFTGLNIMFATDLWAPLGVLNGFGGAAMGPLADLADPKYFPLFLTARLAKGLTLDSLGARLPSLARRLAFIPSLRGKGGRTLEAAAPSRQQIGNLPEMRSDSTGYLALGLFLMAGCVLFIASFNLSNMFLARGLERAKEFALRAALGASRWRIVRPLLLEGMIVACSGGALGLLISVWANDLLFRAAVRVLNAIHFSLALDLHPDARVLGLTFLYGLIATLLFSLLPALKVSRIDLTLGIKGQHGEIIGGDRFDRFFARRHVFLIAQIALSFAVLFCAGLFFQGARNASGINPGFEPAGSLVAELDFTLRKTPFKEARRELFSAIE